MRNPKWHRDELILALDLYFKLEPGQIHARNPAIIELSEILNKLPFVDDKPDAERFRNANGVGWKLSNFLALDDTYHGKGMTATSKLDREVFAEFHTNRSLLSKLVDNIRATLADGKLSHDLLQVGDEFEDATYAVREGRFLYSLHLLRERNKTIVEKKKKEHLKNYGSLACELCSFDFESVYGEAGKGFIECHHRTPLAELSPNTKTTLDDLMLVCSNCHRMLHRGWNISKNKKICNGCH